MELLVALILVAVEFKIYIIVSEAGTGIYYEVVGVGIG